MKVRVETDDSLHETEVLIRCNVADEHVESIVASLRMHDSRILGVRDGGKVAVAAGDILYIESVDAHVFAYTRDAVIEVTLRLCELEEKLEACGFVRAAKGCLVNVNRITSFAPYVGGRLLATLDNQEQVVVSRKYATDIKAKLLS